MITLLKTLEWIEKGREEGLHTGVQLYVSQNGRVIADMGIGEAVENIPMRSDAITIWFSSGKPLTALAIARLWEQGRLGLNDAVTRFVPEFGQNGKERITLKHLLTHTAGFRSADQLPTGLNWEERIQKICEAPAEPDWIPGEKAGYQMTSSWFVLGEIVRRIDGRPLDRFLREEIFLPLGMNDSWIGMPRERFEEYRQTGRLAPMFVRENNVLKPHNFINSQKALTTCRPGSNACGPIRELGRLYEFLLGQFTPAKPVLKRDTIELFTSRHRIALFDQTFLHKIDFGFGFLLNSNRYGRETLPYSYGRFASEETFGHSGSQSSTGFADPQHGLVVAWVFNAMAGERKHQKRAKEMNSAIYEDLGLAIASAPLIGF